VCDQRANFGSQADFNVVERVFCSVNRELGASVIRELGVYLFDGKGADELCWYAVEFTDSLNGPRCNGRIGFDSF